MQTKFQFGEKVIISSECPKHSGKAGVFQFETSLGQIKSAVIEDSITKRQFIVNLNYIRKAVGK